MELEHLDATLLHFQREVVVILLRFVNPDDIVKEKIMAVAGGQPLVGQRRPADHDGPQFADF